MNKIRVISVKDEAIGQVDLFYYFWIQIVEISDRYDLVIGQHEYDINL